MDAENSVVEQIKVGDEYVEYQVSFANDDSEQLRASSSEIAQLIANQFLCCLEEGLAAGQFENRGAWLSIRSDKIDPEISEYLAQFVLELRGHIGNFVDRTGVLVQLTARDLLAKEPPVQIGRTLSDVELAYLEEAKDIWGHFADLAVERLGCVLEPDDLSNFIVNMAIDEPDDCMEAAIMALAAWLGNELIAQTPSLEWAVVSDQGGSDLCVAMADSGTPDDAWIVPSSVVEKRLSRGERFDARGLVDALIPTLL